MPSFGQPFHGQAREAAGSRGSADDLESHAVLLSSKEAASTAVSHPAASPEDDHAAEALHLPELPWYIAYFFYDNGSGDIRIGRALLAVVVVLAVSITFLVGLICARHGHSHPSFQLWLPSFLRASHLDHSTGPHSAVSQALPALSVSTKSTRVAATVVPQT